LDQADGKARTMAPKNQPIPEALIATHLVQNFDQKSLLSFVKIIY
jgi:hypothetical protein